MLSEQIADAVARRRTALGLTQVDLAELAGVSERFVRALEKGKPTVQLNLVEAVLTTLGLSLTITPRKRVGQ